MVISISLLVLAHKLCFRGGNGTYHTIKHHSQLCHCIITVFQIKTLTRKRLTSLKKVKHWKPVLSFWLWMHLPHVSIQITSTTILKWTQRTRERPLSRMSENVIS